MRYGCIERHRGEFPVLLMCRVLEVTRSGFYACERVSQARGYARTSDCESKFE